MVEHIGDSGEWIWYCLHRKLTPQEAIRAYCKEMGLMCGKIKLEAREGVYYSELNDVRAFKLGTYN